MKKYIKILGSIALLIFLLALIFYFATSQAIISFGANQIEQTKTLNWAGVSGTIKAPYFGTLRSGSISTINGVTSYGSGWNVFGDNDGKITISNSYSSTEKLTMSTSISASEKGGSGNYIEAELTLPPGRLSGTCTLSNSIRSGSASSVCEIQGLSFSFGNSIRENSGSTSCGVCPVSGCGCSNSENIDVTLEEETPIKIRLTSSAGGTVQSVSSSALIELAFEPGSLPDPPEAEPPTWTKIWHKISNWFNDLIKKILRIE